MRILDIIVEGESPKFYAIGDSHAEGIANYGGKNWVSLAVRGTASTDSRHKAAIAKIPKGSTVAVCLGCNDAANAALRNQNKEKSALTKTPQQVAANVKSVVDAVNAADLKAVTVLYPPSTKPGPYGSPYSQQCRDAIKAALPGAIDMEGSSLYDGVHASANDYVQVARQIEKSNPVLKPDSAQKTVLPISTMKPGEDKMAHAGAMMSLTVPSGNVNPAVADIQKILLALGYKLPKHGVDGVRGPETRKALKQFQQDNGLEVDGDPGPETVGALNKLIASKKITFAKSTQSDVKGKFASATTPQEVGDIMNDNNEKVTQARDSAEKYLGREMSDEEWTALMKVTAAEENNTTAMAWVMAAILNRTNRGTWGNSVVSVVSAPSQFEPVTGPKGNEKRLHTLPIPSGRKLNAILVGAKEILPSVPKKIVNFTSNIDAAYKGRASISYKDKLIARGGEVVGNSVFAA
jgi:lysophospholipase L1-like esterase